MYASINGNIEAVRELIERGAYVNVKNDYKRKWVKEKQH